MDQAELIHAVDHPDDDIAHAAMKKLRKINPTWHFCCEWDFLAICDNDIEWECCNCYEEKDEKKENKD